MSDIAIHVDRLSKRYRIGGRPKGYKTLREVMVDAVKLPYRRLARNNDGGAPAENFIWALKELSLEIKKGEAVGIIGRNGAGKSTLLKVLSRITRPTQGRAVIYGRVGSLLEVATGFHPELTGRENIYLNGAILGMRRVEIERKYDEIVAFSEVEKFLDTPVKYYSSGMYTRLAFGVAAHLEPEILLVDEVLAVGDIAFQKKCLGKMQDVASEGRTVLFVSHNMPTITRLCSRAFLLDAGELVREGATQDVVAYYLDSMLGAAGSRYWSPDAAPGTSEIRLASVELLKEDGSPASVVSVEEKLLLKIGYRVGIPGMRFRCQARFFTQGICAFVSMEPTEMERAAAGLYYSTVAIPPNLLAEGEYSIAISIFASRGVKYRYVNAKDAIVFEVTDPMTGSSARGDYGERYVGVIRPRLDWQMNYAGEDER